MAEAPVAMMILFGQKSMTFQTIGIAEENLRVGSHEFVFLLLALSPILERSDREVDTGNGLGDDLGAETLTREKQIYQPVNKVYPIKSR